MAAPPMDPRIRRRRIEVRREEGRRRLRFLVASSLAAATVAAAAGATRSPLLDVDRLEVRGARRTPRAQVLAVTGLGRHPLMVEVDEAEVARRVESLPWVLQAEAARRWPGTVRIALTERTAEVVVAAEGGRWALADGSGRVLEVADQKPPGLPVVANLPPPGPPGSSLAGPAGAALSVASALPAQLRPRVSELSVLPGGEVELRLVPPGALARLGRPVRLGQKLATLVTLLDKADLSRAAVIDVRVPQAPTLTRR